MEKGECQMGHFRINVKKYNIEPMKAFQDKRNNIILNHKRVYGSHAIYKKITKHCFRKPSHVWEYLERHVL
jgi:hypothetical protein